MQEEKGDQRDGDLDTHGIFRTAQEVRDPQALLHETEEQFDPPAALAEIGDLLRRRVEIMGENVRFFAGSGLDDDFAHRALPRIFTVPGQKGGQKPDAVVKHGRVRRKLRLARVDEWRGAPQAGRDAAIGGGALRPEAIIVITEVAPASTGISLAAAMSLTLAAVTARAAGQPRPRARSAKVETGFAKRSCEIKNPRA